MSASGMPDGLSFERPILDVVKKIEELKNLSAATGMDLNGEIRPLEELCEHRTREIFSSLTRWQKVQLARHPKRPLVEHYQTRIFDDFIELHGDRLFKDDQALVTGSGFTVPQRATTGFHPKRMAVLLAVLEKRVGIRLSHADVFVNVAGGLRLEEPAADLATALALAGSRLDRPSRGRLVAIGEIGLGGEIRRVGQIETRVREARTFGYEPILVPKAQLEKVKGDGAQVHGVESLSEAIEAGLGEKRKPVAEIVHEDAGE